MGRSALDYACLERKIAIVEILIENYADEERLNEVFLIMMVMVMMKMMMMKKKMMMMLMMIVMILMMMKFFEC